MSKRLGINLVFLNPDRNGGAETYARALLREYQQMPLNVDGRIALFVGRGHGLTVDPDRFELIDCDIDPRHQYRRIIWEQTRLPKILDRHHLDLVHFPYSAYPVRYKNHCVVSIHDTTRFIAPRGVPRAQIWYRRIMEQRLQHLGHHVIAVSEADATVLKDRLSLPTEQVSVVYHGVSDKFRVDRPFDGERHYLLWVGRPYEHKRLDTLIEAYGIIAGTRMPKLRLVGVAAGERAKVERWVKIAGIEQHVSIEPGMDHDALAKVYQHSLALVFPSSYESFGLPALEAMASGTPVICSDIPAFQELYAGVAEMTPTGNAQQLASAIKNLVENPELRSKMQWRGIQHAQRFTWKACAEGTMNVCLKALGSPKIRPMGEGAEL